MPVRSSDVKGPHNAQFIYGSTRIVNKSVMTFMLFMSSNGIREQWTGCARLQVAAVSQYLCRPTFRFPRIFAGYPIWMLRRPKQRDAVKRKTCVNSELWLRSLQVERRLGIHWQVTDRRAPSHIRPRP